MLGCAGIHALHELVAQLRKEGIRLALANPSRQVQAQLKRTDIIKEIGPEWIFVRTADAVKMCSLAVREQQEAGGLPDIVTDVNTDDNDSARKGRLSSSSSGGASSDLAAGDAPPVPVADAAAPPAAAPPAPQPVSAQEDFQTPKAADL